MNHDNAAAQASAEAEERTKVHKAQEVLERTSASVGQVCFIILTLLAIIYTLYFAAGIILPFVLALVFAMVLGPAVRLMNRRLHIPRMIGGAVADRCAVQRRRGAGLCAIGSRFCLDSQSSAVPACIDGQAELSPKADPADGSRSAAAAKCDVAERGGAGGTAERNSDATTRYR